MTRTQRGFTLLEVAVSMAIMGVVLAAIFGVVQGQQTAFYQGNMQRAAQGSVRAALSVVEQKLATAGYGMDPSLAFDFTSAVAPCPALADPCARDRTDGNDELVFYARNPQYYIPQTATDPVGNAWRIVSVVGNTLTIVARGGEVFPGGRILQAVCQNATNYAYFTVSARASAAAADANFPITLTAVTPTSPFMRQDLAAADSCFSSGKARLFLIDRFRFHVRPVAVGSQTIPYLVLDPGLDAKDDGFDENEEIILAEGIESFQVGYDLTNTTLAPRGATPGTAITFTPGFPGGASASGMTTLQFPGNPVTGQAVYQWTSWFNYALTPPIPSQRTTDHQANIRSVRVSLVGRAPQSNATGLGSGSLLPVLNQDAFPAWVDQTTAYNRSRVDATVPVRNMTIRGLIDT